LTKIKAISVLAAALMLTALGASNALAWGATITAPLDCTYVYVTAHDTDNSFRNHPSGDLIFKQAGHADVTKAYTFNTASSSTTQVILKLAQSELSPGSGTVELAVDSTVKASFKILTPLTTGTPSQSAGKVTWPVHNPNTSGVNFLYQLKEDSAQKGSGSAAASSDVTPALTTTLVTGTGITVNTLLLSTVSTSGTPCVEQKVLSLETKPSASASPSASESPAASASPSESAAAASTEPTSSAVPSPPNTGGGSSGSADRSFAFVLLALVLGTVGVGGTTLALSRKGS
jgi:cell division septation protein DedD